MIQALLLILFTAPALSAKVENQVLWKEWYLFTVNGSAVGYFEETVEKRPRDKHIAITQRWTEKEGGKTETYIGSVAEDDKDLKPVAFFSERKGPSAAYKIDGRAKNGKLEITFKPVKPKGGTEKKSITMTGKVLLSNFMPILLARRGPAPGLINFSAIVEDAKDGIFDLREVKAETYGVTKEIGGTKCRRSVVEFAGMEGEWWVSEEGKLCRLHIPGNNSKLELTTEKEAKKALPLE